MATLGIDLCDAAFQAAVAENDNVRLLAPADAQGAAEWPGFAYYDGQKFAFGRAAEDNWFVHPRRVAHTFWARLAHEPSAIGPIGKAAAFSELAFHFFREFMQRAAAVAGTSPGKVVLAVPGAYLKDPATEEEKIGLLLGMAGELNLPLAGIVDAGCATLCDPRAGGFNPALPVVLLDLHLEGADITLLTAQERLERRDFIHLPQSGFAALLKHFTGAMGNRFLRHTAFDILEDGRIEQMFFRQAKDFLLNGAAEHRFQINTAKRTYEMLAKREQLVADAQAFVTTLVQGLQNFLHSSPHAAEPCTLALTDRTARVPGLETKLRASGYHRILRLPAGAGACGAARIGEIHPRPAADLADVPVDTAVPVALARRTTAAAWDVRLQKLRTAAGPRPSPTHAVLEGIGHAIPAGARFTIGVGSLGADLTLPAAFDAADDCSIPLVREGGRLWFVDHHATRQPGAAPSPAPRTPVEAGDRLTFHSGGQIAEILFAHCNGAPGARAHD
ncbi:MAG: hypothetical protein JNL39_02790 [Opitutaceae bacterium]|nr:hypothetical protein [Opitutaceae bacterium]